MPTLAYRCATYCFLAESLQPLLTKHDDGDPHLSRSISRLYYRSLSQVRAAPPRMYQLVYVVSKISIKEWQYLPPRAFNISHSQLVFKFRPSPLFEKQASIGAPHPKLPKHLYYKATDWHFSIVIISWAKVSSILLRNRSQDSAQDMWCIELQWESLRNMPVVYHASRLSS